MYYVDVGAAGVMVFGRYMQSGTVEACERWLTSESACDILGEPACMLDSMRLSISCHAWHLAALDEGKGVMLACTDGLP